MMGMTTSAVAAEAQALAVILADPEKHRKALAEIKAAHDDAAATMAAQQAAKAEADAELKAKYEEQAADHERRERAVRVAELEIASQRSQLNRDMASFESSKASILKEQAQRARILAGEQDGIVKWQAALDDREKALDAREEVYGRSLRDLERREREASELHQKATGLMAETNDRLTAVQALLTKGKK